MFGTKLKLAGDLEVGEFIIFVHAILISPHKYCKRGMSALVIKDKYCV
jgi:hypothetical protein